jgi:hypothetical protein
MKKVMERGRMVVLAFVLVSAFGITTTKAQGSVSLQVFYDELQPYGTWMDYGTYGYVWVPRVDRSFVPYGTNGYWINTEYGNTWVSDYSWGWAPFHYGRWLFDDFYGWIWVPDTEWAPAWVAWRSGGGYYGWAPLMPGIGIHLTFHHYDRIPHHYWNFVPYRYVTYRHVYRHCVPRPRVVNIYHHTTIINNNYTDNRSRTYFSGPSRHEIEKRGGGRVTVHKVSETNRPGRTEVSRSTANFYRPEIDNSRESRSKSIPGRYVKKDQSGNVQEVVTRRRPNEYNSSRSMNEIRNNTTREQKSSDVQSLDERRYDASRDVQQREYMPSQRTRPSVNEKPSRSYEQIQRERENNARDRYEAPPVQRAPMNRDVQRRTSSQPRQWQQTERQGTTRQRANVQPQNNRSDDFNRRSTVQPSQRSTQFRKSDSGNNNNRQPSRSTGRQFKRAN